MTSPFGSDKIKAEVERRVAERRVTTTQMVDPNVLTAALAKSDDFAHIQSQIDALSKWRDALDRRWFTDDLKVAKDRQALVDAMTTMQDHVNKVIDSMNGALDDVAAMQKVVSAAAGKVSVFEAGRAKWLRRMKHAAWAGAISGGFAALAVAKFVFHLG